MNKYFAHIKSNIPASVSANGDYIGVSSKRNPIDLLVSNNDLYLNISPIGNYSSYTTHISNINTCIDTSGSPFTKEGEWFQKFQKLMDVTDILLMDIKHIDEDEHKKLTGQSGKNIIEMFRYLDEINKPIWIRHVLVPGITDNDEYLTKTRDFIRTLHNVKRVEILPYHGLGIIKYKEMNIDYPLKDLESPTKERVENAKKILECDKYTDY
jgi:pyruvate formate lyase activating enzyme